MIRKASSTRWSSSCILKHGAKDKDDWATPALLMPWAPSQSPLPADTGLYQLSAHDPLSGDPPFEGFRSQLPVEKSGQEKCSAGVLTETLEPWAGVSDPSKERPPSEEMGLQVLEALREGPKTAIPGLLPKEEGNLCAPRRKGP